MDSADDNTPSRAATGAEGQHPAHAAAHRLAEASSRSLTGGIASAAEVLAQLEGALDDIQETINLMADSTTAVLPIRVWLGEAGDAAGEASTALSLPGSDFAPSSGDAPGQIAAGQLREAAADFRRCAQSETLSEDDLATLVPVVEEAVDALSDACFELDDLGLTGRDNDDTATVSSAGEHLRACSQRLSDATEGLVQAALDDRVARAAEAAWAVGTQHGLAGQPAQFERALLAEGNAGSTALASALGLPPTADGSVLAAAITAYVDAHAGASENPGRTSERRYVPGQKVTTALGRAGVLTGQAGPGDRPRIRFEDGQEETLPREAIRAPLAHIVDAMPDEVAVPCAREGDVVLVAGATFIPWVQTAEGLRPACGDTATLGRRRCEYEDSVRLAEQAMGLKPDSLFNLDQYASPFDVSRYNGGVDLFPGWKRSEIEKLWERPPGSMRASDYGTEAHLARLVSEVTALGFPSAVAPSAPSAPSARPTRAPATQPAASPSARPVV